MIEYIYIAILHFLIINPCEKLLAQSLFKDVYRPLPNCGKDDISLACLGMPSGHTETISVIIFLLLLKNKIPALIATIVIIIIGSQRILASLHTLGQVCVGMILGLIYAFIYFGLDKFTYIFIVSIVYIITLLILILVIIDKKVNEPIPIWVDPSLYPMIKKKQDDNFFDKFLHIVNTIRIYDHTLMCSWDMLEKQMDKLLTMTNKKFDLVVGIKSGGAIMSNYMANKLNIPYKYVKISNICNKNSMKTEFYDMINRTINKKLSKYICEGINDDITNLDILLVDEQIASGTTIKDSYEYLMNKGAKSVTIYCINNFNKNLKYEIYSITDKYYSIYPWGYAN